MDIVLKVNKFSRINILFFFFQLRGANCGTTSRKKKKEDEKKKEEFDLCTKVRTSEKKI